MAWSVTGAAGGTQPCWACKRIAHCCAQAGSVGEMRVCADERLRQQAKTATAGKSRNIVVVPVEDESEDL